MHVSDNVQATCRIYLNVMYKTQILYRIEPITFHTPDVENPAAIVAFNPFRVPLQ